MKNLKLKEAARKELLYAFPGRGWLMLAVPMNTIVQLNVWLGKNGNWYVGNGRLLIDHLSDIKMEIDRNREEGMEEEYGIYNATIG